MPRLSRCPGLKALLLTLMLCLPAIKTSAHMEAVREAYPMVADEILEAVSHKQDRIIKIGADYDLDELCPGGDDTPNLCLFLGYMTDHILIDQQALDPEINYLETLAGTPFDPVANKGSPTNIQEGESAPQYLDHLQVTLQELVFDPPEEGRDSPENADSVTTVNMPQKDRLVLCGSPQGYVYHDGGWKPLQLPPDKPDIKSRNAKTNRMLRDSTTVFSAAWPLIDLQQLNPCLKTEGCHLIKLYVPVAYPGGTTPDCYVELSSTLLQAHSHAQHPTSESFPPKSPLFDQTSIPFEKAPAEQSKLCSRTMLPADICAICNMSPVISPASCQTRLQLFACDIDDSTFYTSGVGIKGALNLILDKPKFPIQETITLMKALAAHQVIPVYLSAMPPLAIDIVRQALFKHSIPGLIISFRPAFLEMPGYSPGTHGHRTYGSIAFKSRVMQALAGVGHITGALGDQLSDCSAYASAGLLPENIWVVCREGLFRASVLAGSAP